MFVESISLLIKFARYAKDLRTAHVKTVYFGGVHESKHILSLTKFISDRHLVCC